MGDATLLGKENFGIGGNRLKEEKKVSTGRLADITNLQQRPKLSIKDPKMQHPTSLSTNEYIEKLQKENVTLMKVLADRNKVIEISGMELQKLRINLQKVQLQNLHLAQANSQMLAELNSGKDKLKALQHELGCKNGLLKAKQLEAAAEVATKKCDMQGECEESKPCNTKRKEQANFETSGCSTVKPVHTASENVKKSNPSRRQSARFKAEPSQPTEDASATDTTEFAIVPMHDEMVLQSLPASSDPSPEKQLEEANTSSGQSDARPMHPGIEKADNKRRKSNRLNSQVPEPNEDVFEKDAAKFPVSPLREEMEHSNAPTTSAPKGQEGSEVQDLKRTSVGRPLRRAVEKIQSYKEIPLKVKMRRMV